MPTSGPQQARRAFIKLILVLAVSYTLEVGLHQSSLDSQVTAAFRKIVKRVHPDKGGSTEHVQQLHAAKDAWDQARRHSKVGRPKEKQGDPAKKVGGKAVSGSAGSADAGQEGKDYNLETSAVLFTYHGFTSIDQWKTDRSNRREQAPKRDFDL